MTPAPPQEPAQGLRTGRVTPARGGVTTGQSRHRRAGAAAAMRHTTTSETQRDSAHGAHMYAKDGDASSPGAGRQPVSGFRVHT